MNTKISVISLVIVLAIVGIVFFVSKSNTSQKDVGAETGPASDAKSSVRVPDFSLLDYEGKTVKSSDFAGKSMIINSWASWCPFCKKELPDFVAVKKEFGDQTVFIAIDRGEPLDVAKKYSDLLGVTKELVFLLDEPDSFYQAIGGFSMPETIFVDKSGIIRDHKRGPMDAAEIRERLRKILN